MQLHSPVPPITLKREALIYTPEPSIGRLAAAAEDIKADENAFDERIALHLAWRESDGDYTRMRKIGCGGIQFCSFYELHSKVERVTECVVNLLGPVFLPNSYPKALVAAVLDGESPFRIIWEPAQRCNLGHLNEGFLSNAILLGQITVKWRPDVLNQDIERSFIIPIEA